MRLHSLVIAVSLIPLAATAAAKKAPDCGLTYLDSTAHLQKAMAGSEAIKGLAVSADFYKSATPEQKKSIAGLVEDVRVKPCHPVMVYGFPLTHDAIVEVVGDIGDNNGFALVVRLESDGLETNMTVPKPGTRAGIPARACWTVSYMKELSRGKCR